MKNANKFRMKKNKPVIDDRNIRNLISAISKKEKKSILCEALKKKDMKSYFTLSKIMIDIPLDKGGLTSDEVQEIFNKCFKNYFTNNIGNGNT